MLLDNIKHGLYLTEDQHTMLTDSCGRCQVSLTHLLNNTNTTLMK